MSHSTDMVIDDPSKFYLLASDVKEKMIKAGIATVNIMAAKARKEAVKNIEHNFTTRNTFTARQVQFTPMPEGRYSLSAIHSTVGITQKASYMKRQEEGGEHAPSKGSTLAIPTDAARGGVKSNTVQIKVKNLLNKNRRVHGASHPFKRKTKSGKIIRVKAKTYNSNKAFQSARGFIALSKKLYLPWGGSGDQRNLYRVTGVKVEGRGTHRKVEFEKEEAYNFEYKKTKTEKQPWLLPACEKVQQDVQQIFNSQIKKQGL